MILLEVVAPDTRVTFSSFIVICHFWASGEASPEPEISNLRFFCPRESQELSIELLHASQLPRRLEKERVTNLRYSYWWWSVIFERARARSDKRGE